MMTTTTMNDSSGRGEDNSGNSNGDDDENDNDDNNNNDDDNDDKMPLPPCPFTIWLLCAFQAANMLQDIPATLQISTRVLTGRVAG
jgi:hypothetical protein